MTQKVYYRTDFTERGPIFIGQDGSKIYFAGGNKEKPKYIHQALVEKYGKDKAEEIYYGFLEGLEAIEGIETGKNFKFPTASLVLYKEDDDKDEIGRGNKRRKRFD